MRKNLLATLRHKVNQKKMYDVITDNAMLPMSKIKLT